MPRAADRNTAEHDRDHRRSLGFVAGSVLVVVLTYVVLQACARQPEANADSFCREAPALADLDEALASLDAGRIRAVLGALNDLERSAPPEIDDQVATLRALSSELAYAVGSGGADSADAARQVWRAHEGDLARIEAAARAVADYASVACGLDIAGTTTTGAAPIGPTTAAPR